MSTIKLETFVGYENVKFDQETENYVLAKLTGAKIEADTKRPPITIVALLDVSSSMSPEYKIGYLKKSMVKLIENLTDKDVLAMVSYDSSVHKIFDLAYMDSSSKSKAIQVVNNLRANGCTNMSGALAQAIDILNNGRDFIKGEDRVIRTILFTDGYPTAGNTDKDFIADLCSKLPIGQVTTMGYGQEVNDFSDNYGMNGGVDIPQLQRMAKKGKGNYYFMKDPDSCATAFAYELAGLLTTVGQNVQIMLDNTDRIEVVEVLDDFDVEEKNGNPVAMLPDIISEEEKYVCFKIKCLKQSKHLPRPITICKVQMQYYDIEGKPILETIPIKVNFVKDSASSALHAEVKDHLEILKALELQRQATLAVIAGDFEVASEAYSHAEMACSVGTTDRSHKLATRFADMKEMVKDAGAYAKNQTAYTNFCHSNVTGRSSGSGDAAYATSSMRGMAKSFDFNDNGGDNSGDVKLDSLRNKESSIVPKGGDKLKHPIDIKVRVSKGYVKSSTTDRF